MQFMTDLAKSLVMLTLVAMTVAASAIPAPAAPQAQADSKNEIELEAKAQKEASADTTPPKDKQRNCVVIRVPLPITLSSGQQIQRTLQVVASEVAESNAAENRPVVMLEFETDKSETGGSSILGPCNSLADFLTSPEMLRVQTIAYIPADSKRKSEIKGQLTGHAVLVAISCSEIAMEHDTAIGNAGSGDVPPAYVVETYKHFASQRYALPVEVVLSMLQKDRGLFRVTTPEKVVFADEQELKKLEEKSLAIETTTLAAPNERALLTSEQLQKFRLINYRVKSKSELASKLNLAPDQLNADASDGGTWTAITIKVPEFLDQRTARWITRSATPAIARHNANLLFLEIDDSVGDLEAGVELARVIADFDTAKVRTVAVINKSARSGSALAAMACDQILINDSATLGGFEPAPEPGADRPNSVSSSYRTSYRNDAKSIAAEKKRDWSMFAAMIDPEIEVGRYRNADTNDVRLLSSEEWESIDDADQWKLLGVIDTLDGLKPDQLKQLSIASNIIENQSDVKTIYQLSEDPLTLTPSPSERWIQSLASFLTSPAVATFLIMGGFFFISTEMSAPGLGVPGFLGTLCLLAFFWAQYFDGNAEWFEILLFVIGITFILMEVFVIPGFGIFGIGGTIMVCISIVLAAQSFLVPLNVRDMEKLPNSLFPLVGAGFGILVAVLALPRILPDTPFLRNVILSPPKQPELEFGDSKDTEATADFAHLMGKRGTAATKLMPSGRAKFGDEICDVISQGQVIDKGESVEVIEAVANRVVVKKA